FPNNGNGPWLDLISKAGSRDQLTQVLEKSLGDDFSDEAKIKGLKSLSEAARLRQVTPQKKKEEINQLFANSNPEIKAAALRLAGQWKLHQFTKNLLEEAGKATAAAVRDASFQSLR